MCHFLMKSVVIIKYKNNVDRCLLCVNSELHIELIWGDIRAYGVLKRPCENARGNVQGNVRPPQ